MVGSVFVVEGHVPRSACRRWAWSTIGPGRGVRLCTSGPAFHDRFHARYADAGLHDGDAFVFEDRVERGRVLAVAVADQVIRGGADIVEVPDQVAGQLCGPGRGGWAVAPKRRTRRVAASYLDLAWPDQDLV